jgi:lipoic acid synthetase
MVLMRALAERSADDYLLLLEHPSVYTLGVRADPAHVLADPAEIGADLVRTDRGGDVTWHGPGQLVAYPVLTVPDDPGSGPAHVATLTSVVLAALADVGLPARCRPGFPGVWRGGPDDEGPWRKLGAIGVRTVRTADGRRRTLHGVALNVDPDLSVFGRIVPCGLPDPVSSVAAEGCGATMDEVTGALAARAVARWGPGAERQDVVTGPAGGTGPRLTVRLRQAGATPEDGLPLSTRKPDWLRVPVRRGPSFTRLDRAVRTLDLVTVCEEAGCPNIWECWGEGTATFMVNGERCTRACAFCKVDTSHPLPLDPGEPQRVAEAVARMDLAHAVVTCVARDDLADGGAGALAATVRAIRERRPGTAVEVLISDCRGDPAALDLVFEARPDVLNHNLETVARLQRAVRPSAGYARSLGVLARAADAGLVTKSGLMVGLGETPAEVEGALADLAGVGVSIATVGQYLRPSAAHAPVARWWAPEEFEALAQAGRTVGLAHVEASPLTRSSYHARSAAARAGATV